MHSKNRESA